jgi:hypothetical protein
VEVINLEIKNDSINFGPAKGSFPQVQTKDIGFELFNPTKAIVVLTGADFGYSQSGGTIILELLVSKLTRLSLET